MPVCCVDVVLYHQGKVLLILRKNEPEKGRWWIPGGRVYKNEMLGDAVRRKIREEIGIDVRVEKKIGVYEYFSDKTHFEDVTTGTHSVPVCFVAIPVAKDVNIHIDATSSSYRWIDHIEDDLDHYVKEVIQDSGVFE